MISSSRIDGSVSSPITVNVPKVSVYLNPRIYFIGSKWGDIEYYNSATGTGLHAVVTGIEPAYYELEWAIESNVYQGFGSSIPLTGTYLLWDNNDAAKKDSVFMHFGTEPSSLKYFRIRANIKGYSNKSAISKVVIGQAELKATKVSKSGGTISNTNAAIERPETTADVSYYKTTLSTTDQSVTDGFDPSEVKWFIESVCEEGSTENLAVDGKFDGLTVDTKSVGANYLGVLSLDSSKLQKTSKTLVVTLYSTWGSFKSNTITEKIKPITFEIEASTTAAVNRGETVQFTASSSLGSNITWTVVSVKNSSTKANVANMQSEISKLAFTGSGTNVSLDIPYDLYTTNDAALEITVKGEVKGQSGFSAAATVNVSKVEFSVQATKANNRYTYQAVYSGLTAKEGASIGYDWGVNTTESTSGMQMVDSAAGTSTWNGVTLENTNQGSNLTLTINNAQSAPSIIKVYTKLRVKVGSVTYNYENPVPIWNEIKLGFTDISSISFGNNAAKVWFKYSQSSIEIPASYTVSTSASTGDLTSGYYVIKGQTAAYTNELNTAMLYDSVNGQNHSLSKKTSGLDEYCIWYYDGNSLKNYKTDYYLTIDFGLFAGGTPTLASNYSQVNIDPMFGNNYSGYGIYQYHYNWVPYYFQCNGTSISASRDPNLNNDNRIREHQDLLWDFYSVTVTQKKNKLVGTYNNNLYIYTTVQDGYYYFKVVSYQVNSEKEAYVRTSGQPVYFAYDPAEQKWARNNDGIWEEFTNTGSNARSLTWAIGFSDDNLTLKALCDSMLEMAENSTSNFYFKGNAQNPEEYQPKLN